MSDERRKGPEMGLIVGAGLGIALGLLFREMAVGIALGAILGFLFFVTRGRARGRGRREED